MKGKRQSSMLPSLCIHSMVISWSVSKAGGWRGDVIGFCGEIGEENGAYWVDDKSREPNMRLLYLRLFGHAILFVDVLRFSREVVDAGNFGGLVLILMAS
jgi:hypothetical protein